MCQKPRERFLLDWRRKVGPEGHISPPAQVVAGTLPGLLTETGERVVLSLVRFLRNLILSPILPVFLSWGLGFPSCNLYHLLRTPPVYAF